MSKPEIVWHDSAVFVGFRPPPSIQDKADAEHDESQPQPDRRVVIDVQRMPAAAERACGRFGWRPSGNSHHRWTDAAALSLEDLLRSDELARVRQCKRCTWLFVDRGRGVGRRWCAMRTCGNRAKAEAFRER
jgi:predicted RNA-binding Zn ribbon-like protein